MKYIIRAWSNNGGAKYYEFMTLEEAKEMADFFADRYKAQGVEYDVMIYEATNY